MGITVPEIFRRLPLPLAAVLGRDMIYSLPIEVVRDAMCEQVEVARVMH